MSELEFVYEGPRTWLGLVEETAPGSLVTEVLVKDAIEWQRVTIGLLQQGGVPDSRINTNPGTVERLTSLPEVRVRYGSRVRVASFNEADQATIKKYYGNVVAAASKTRLHDVGDKPRIVIPGVNNGGLNQH